jgi:serine protease Do
MLAGAPWPPPTAIAASSAAPPAKERRIAQARLAAPAVDFPTIVERYGPAVVNISPVTPEPQPSASAPAPDAIDPDDPFYAFFKRGAPQQPVAKENAPRAISGTGSGFIVSADGLIVTTAHVVDQAAEMTVRLTDRREFKASVVAVDAQSDVALLQVDATKLPTVKLGDSSHVRVGEQVLTIGSPDSYGNAVTTGIISATSRTLPDGSSFPFFQTDVAANPDNSGGPLFNRAGEVVGIAVEIYSGADRYPSLTFAIPINLVAKVRAQAQAQRKAPGGGFGLEVQDVGPGLAAAFGLPRPAGALVNSVEPGTPAAAIGLKPGDVIMRIGNKAIGSSAELAEDAAALPPGTRTSLRIIRNRRPMTLPVTVGAGAFGESAGPEPAIAGAGDRLGLTMHPLTDEERRTTGLAVGMMVDEVHGPAASAGIQPGDVVLELNDTLIETPDVVPALEAKAGKVIAVLIQRDNARKFVSVTLR